MDGGRDGDKQSPFVGRGEYMTSGGPGGDTSPMRPDQAVLKKAADCISDMNCASRPAASYPPAVLS